MEKLVSAKAVLTSLEKYIRMLKRLGFRQVLEIPFTMPGDRSEKFFVFYQPEDAILLGFDTRLGIQVNSGTFYFNWRIGISEEELYRDRPVSLPEGYWSDVGERNVYVGHDYVPGHDISAVIETMKKYGTFISPWVESQDIDFSRHFDRESLPPEVRKAILR